MSSVEMVTIDTREPDEMVELFENHDEVEDVSVSQLEIGDYLVWPELDDLPVVFERKSTGDYVGSIRSRRLENQIKDMYSEFDPERSFLLVEGNMEDFDFLPYSDFSSKSVRGFTASIAARWQMIPLLCSDKFKLADMVVRISRKTSEDPSRTIREPENTPTEADGGYLDRAVMQLDGVGKDLTSKLKDEYDSVSSLSEASQDELEEISGIGGTKAEKIAKQLGGEL